MINVAEIGSSAILTMPVYGPVGDYTQAFKTAINQCPENGVIYLPVGKYFTSEPIRLRRGQSIVGENGSSSISHDGACHILGRSDLDPILSITGGGRATNLFINRAVEVGGQNVSEWRTGLLVEDSSYSRVSDVYCYRHGTGILVRNSLGVMIQNSMFYGCHGDYVVMENAIQATIRDCSLGRDGGEGGVCPGILQPDHYGGSCIRIGGASDTITIDRVQLNPTAGFVDRGVFWFGLSPSSGEGTDNNGITRMTLCHMDLIRHPFWIDNITDRHVNVNLLMSSDSTLIGDPEFPFIGSRTNQQDRIRGWKFSNVVWSGKLNEEQRRNIAGI